MVILVTHLRKKSKSEALQICISISDTATGKRKEWFKAREHREWSENRSGVRYS